MRTKSATLITAEKSTQATPVIKLTFSNGVGGATTYTYTTTDSPNRIKLVDFNEQPYDDSATIILSNKDHNLPNLQGFYTLVDFGYYVAGLPYYPTPAGPAPLWVVRQTQISKEGDCDVALSLEGPWRILSRMEDIASLLGAVSPYYEIEYLEDTTVYTVIDAVLAAANFELLALGIHSDSIIDVLQPNFWINSVGFENATNILYRLLNMTKCFMRTERTVAVSEVNGLGTGWLQYPMSNRSFYAKGRYWVFSESAYTIRHQSSLDGITWTSPAYTIINLFYIGEFGVFVDTNEDCHIAWVESIFGSYWRVKYWKVELNTDGTIDYTQYTASPQTIRAYPQFGTIEGVYYATVAVDKDGYPSVCWSYATDDVPLSKYFRYCRSTTADGVWNAAGEANIAGGLQCHGSVYATTDGNIAVVYGNWTTMQVRKRNADYTWATAQTIGSVRRGSSGSNLAGSYSVVGGLDKLEIAWLELTTSDIEHRSWTWSTGALGTQTQIQVGSGTYYPIPAVTINAAGNCAVIWYNMPVANTVYYCERVGGAWGTVQTVGSYTPYANNEITGFQLSTPDKFCFVFKLSTGVLYLLFFAGAGSSGMLAQFRVVYPSAWASYHATYLSDRPDAASYQFRELGHANHLQLPTHIYVIANRVDQADGTWDEAQIVTGEFIRP